MVAGENRHGEAHVNSTSENKTLIHPKLVRGAQAACTEREEMTMQIPCILKVEDAQSRLAWLG
jgi:hypothetical protein